MKHCRLCKVDVDTNNECCPLCYNILSDVSEKETSEIFQSPKALEQQKKKLHIVTKIFILLSVIALSVCFFVNIMTKTQPWSVVVLFSLLEIWVLVMHTIKSHDTPFKKVLLQLICVIAILGSTNIIFSTSDWLTNYVYPSLAMLVSLVLSLIVLFWKHRKNVMFSFFSIMVLLMILSAIFLIFAIDKFKLLNQINLIFEGCLALAYLLFGGKVIFEDAKRKYHL